MQECALCVESESNDNNGSPPRTQEFGISLDEVPQTRGSRSSDGPVDFSANNGQNSVLQLIGSRQEEHLRHLTCLHKDMLQKVEAEWMSLLSAPLQKHRTADQKQNVPINWGNSSSLETGSGGQKTVTPTLSNEIDMDLDHRRQSVIDNASLQSCPKPGSKDKDARTDDGCKSKVAISRKSLECPSDEQLEDSLAKRGTGRKSMFTASRSLSSEIKATLKNTTFDRLNGLVRDRRIIVEVKKSEKDMIEKRLNALKKFVKSNRFDHLSAMLVITNSLFIGFQVELMFKTSEEDASIRYVDGAFCILFICELMVRFYTYGRREYFFGKDYTWNWFDFVIVSFSTLDTAISLITQGKPSIIGSISVLRTARILRVTRALRIIRVLKFFKDLRIMISAIISTLKTAAWAFLLLLIAMYVFGIAIAQVVGDYKQQEENKGTPLASDDKLLVWFGSLPQAIFTLFMAITGGIDYEISSTPLKKLPVSLVIYIFFIIFSTFCVMNVMTGIFCQNAIETFENDKENMIECQLAEKERFVATLTTMFKEWDTAGDGQCTREEFEKHISDQEVQILLRTLDIDARDAIQLFTMLDSYGSGCVDLEDFVHGCITLRGKAKAVHMERALVDSKLANTKLDNISRTLKELRTVVGEESLFLGKVRPPIAKATSGKISMRGETVGSLSREDGTVKGMTTGEEGHQSSQGELAKPPHNVRPKAPPEESPLLFAPGVIPEA